MKRKPSTGTTTLWYKLITSFENIHLCDKGPNSDHGMGVWPSDSTPLLLLDRAAHLDKGPELEKSSQIEKLDPVGSTVRYEMMKLCTGSV